MIDDLRIALFSARASTIYLVIASVIGSVFLLGMWAGVGSREEICASDIVEAERLRSQNQALNDQLTLCEAQCSANCAIDCEAVCAEQVNNALANAQAWACED